jgi:hypothetical protein
VIPIDGARALVTMLAAAALFGAVVALLAAWLLLR